MPPCRGSGRPRPQHLWDPGGGTCPPTSHVASRGSATERFPQHLPPTRRWERAPRGGPGYCVQPTALWARHRPSLNAGLGLQDAPGTLHLAGTSPSVPAELCSCPIGEPGAQSAGDDPGGTRPGGWQGWARAPQHVPGGRPGLLSQWRFLVTYPPERPRVEPPSACRPPRCPAVSK